MSNLITAVTQFPDVFITSLGSLPQIDVTLVQQGSNAELKIWVYLGVKTCEVFLCFVAIVRVRVYYVDFFVFFGLHHW